MLHTRIVHENIDTLPTERSRRQVHHRGDLLGVPNVCVRKHDMRAGGGLLPHLLDYLGRRFFPVAPIEDEVRPMAREDFCDAEANPRRRARDNGDLAAQLPNGSQAQRESLCKPQRRARGDALRQARGAGG